MYDLFSQKKVLIVDDFAEFRMSLRSMVDGFGCAGVDLAKNGEEAVNLYQQERHEIVLCDYNLGEQQNGQQVLEEISLRGWLSPDTIFVLITAETSLSMVMGALEFRPDDYLSKPINKANLKTRLKRLLEQKSALADVYKALGQHDYPLARQRCAHHIKQKSRYRGVCYRLLAEILLRQDKPAEAKSIYQQMIDVRASLWALQGLAQSLFMLGEYDACIETAERILTDNSRAIDAIELISQCYAAKQDWPQAYEHVKQAITISPRSIKRQRMAANIAQHCKDQQAELRALRHIHELGKHSVQAEADDHVKYLTTLLQTSEDTSGVERRRLMAEAQEQVSRFARTGRTDDRHRQQSTLLQAQLALTQGGEAQAESLLSQVFEDAPEMMQQQDELTIAMLQQALHKANMTEHHQHIEQKLSESRQHHQQREQLAAKSQYNVRGIQQYEAGDYVTAIDSFREALATNSGSTAITLNLVQALLKHLPPGTDRLQVRDECTKLLNQQRFLQPNNPRYKRYQMLKAKIHQL